MELIELLDRDGDAIVRDALDRLGCAGLRHYETSGAACNEERLRTLFEVTRAAVRGRTLVPVVEYAERIARERFSAGFGLQEVQAAINALEAAIWHRVAQAIPPQQYPAAFGLASSVLGAAKEALAVEYVVLASQSRAPALDIAALLEAV